MTEENCTENEKCCNEKSECTSACTDEQAKMEARKMEEKMLMAEAVKNCTATTDPMVMIAQLALAVTQMQKDLSNMEKAIGQHLAEIVNHFNTQMQRLAQPTNKAPTPLKAVPTAVNGQAESTPAA